MSTGIIIFARMSSRRLPGKSLVALGDRPLLGRVIDRVRGVPSAAGIAVATSTDPSDDPIAAFARSEGVAVYRGSLDDVLGRGVACARAQGWRAFARVCGDRPFLDPIALDRAIRRMDDAPDGSLDLVTNMIDRAVPPGLTNEVIRTETLDAVRARTSDPHHREHLTRYLYDHAAQFLVEDAGAPPPETAGLRLVVDTPDDLERARFIVAQLDDPAAADLAAIARHARAWERKPVHESNA